jgi:hypothetical protein
MGPVLPDSVSQDTLPSVRLSPSGPDTQGATDIRGIPSQAARIMDRNPSPERHRLKDISGHDTELVHESTK